MKDPQLLKDLVEYLLGLLAALAGVIKFTDAYFKAKANKTITQEEYSALKTKCDTNEVLLEDLKERVEKNESAISNTKDYMTDKLLSIITKYK